MTDRTQFGLHAARPRVAVDGRDDSALVERLQRLEIGETVAGLHRCEAKFANWGTRDGRPDFLYFDRSQLEFGKAFVVRLDNDILFEGRILALEASFPEGQPAEITVLAEDRFQDLRMTRRTRSFANVSDAEVIRKIAGEHGLEADVRMPGPTHRTVAQVNQSDLAFARERARGVDAELWAEGRKLHAVSRSARRTSPLEMVHGHQLRSFTVLADLAHQRSSVAVTGWDVASKSALNEVAGESAIQDEVRQDASGASILKRSLGDRAETLAHTVPLNRQEARAVAESHFKGLSRRFVVGRGVAETQPRLRVGTAVELKNLGPLFNGGYYVVEVKHLFDSLRGLRTEFTAERAGLGNGR